MNTSTPAATTSTRVPNKSWQIGLWVAQMLLALAFLMAGAMKTFTPIDLLEQKMPWVTEVPNLIRFIGISELLGALGLILPAATRIRPVLSPFAALGLVVIMVLAAGFHIMRGEAQMVPVNAAFGGLAVLVAWGRLRRAPISPRA